MKLRYPIPYLFAAGAILTGAVCLPTSAQNAADKSQFSLINPTPRPLWRDLSPDRPDATESPITVDAGRFQIEADAFIFSYDRHNVERANLRVERSSFAPFLLKVGLLHNVDFHLGIEPHVIERTLDRDTRAEETKNGFGDTLARLKINFWGNDGGPTAMGIMPFLKIPTNEDDLGNDSIEGGVLFPFGIELSKDWGLGLMSGVDFVRNRDDSGYDTSFVNTLVLGRSLTDRVGAFVEFSSEVASNSDSDLAASVNGGLTYSVSSDFMLDVGVNFGVTRAADDIISFIGFTKRF